MRGRRAARGEPRVVREKRAAVERADRGARTVDGMFERAWQMLVDRVT